MRTSVGWIWLVGSLVLLALHIWQSAHGDFVSLSYYVVAWGSLLVFAACGFWFLIDGPGAKWLLRIAAVLVALFTALNFLISWDHAGAEGIDPIFYGVLVVILLFCAFTIAVAGMPGSTPLNPELRR